MKGIVLGKVIHESQVCSLYSLLQSFFHDKNIGKQHVNKQCYTLQSHADPGTAFYLSSKEINFHPVL